MQHLREPIKATLEITALFFVLSFLLMVAKYRPDFYHSPAEIRVMGMEVMTLVQCATPGALVSGMFLVIGAIGFPLGYIAQYVCAPPIMGFINARLQSN